MNLYLIGYRGSGKSTIGPLVADALDSRTRHWKSVDADDLVESESGMSIAMIFDEYGESEFRRRETKTIKRLAEQSGLVVSLGGGAPMFAANRDLISRTGKTVWLRAQADELWQRLAVDSAKEQQRPNLTDQGGRDEVVQLLQIRNPVYEGCADYTIDVDRLTPQEIGEQIVNWFKSDDNYSV